MHANKWKRKTESLESNSAFDQLVMGIIFYWNVQRKTEFIVGQKIVQLEKQLVKHEFEDSITLYFPCQYDIGDLCISSQKLHHFLEP